MNFIKNKKGFITHPGWLFIFGVLLGLVAAYVWARGYIAVASPFCVT